MEHEYGTLTIKMNTLFHELEDEFGILYTKADFQNVMKQLKQARNTSKRPSVLSQLYEMLDKSGISYQKGKSNNYYESLIQKSHFPTLSELENRIVYALYSRYEAYPLPENYMLNIVDKLCNPNDPWQEDTLRLRILKQFIKYGNYLRDADFGGKNTVCTYAKEKQSLQPGKHSKKPSEEEVLALIDDHIFDKLETATKAQKKPKGIYGLLKVADDLATGKFRREGATKKELYMFAMVYNMTFNGDSESSDPADVEKNLFVDYYRNNLLRFITDSYRGNLSDYELDPSGQGINYKNFAEMIYLYFIASDHTPQDKIRLSSEMIARVQNSGGSDTAPFSESADDGYTVYYRDLIRTNDPNQSETSQVLKLSEPEFEEFIKSHYDCSVKKGTGALQQNTAQNTAYRKYRKIIRALERELKESGAAPEESRYGLWFTDVDSFRDRKQDLTSLNPSINGEKFDEFIDLLANANRFVKGKPGENNSPLSLSSPEEVTRTSMLVAYYYYYNACHEYDEEDERMTFAEHFDDFVSGESLKDYGYLDEGINEILAESFYQPISAKNLFDVLLIFSSYAYIQL